MATLKNKPLTIAVPSTIEEGGDYLVDIHIFQQATKNGQTHKTEIKEQLFTKRQPLRAIRTVLTKLKLLNNNKLKDSVKRIVIKEVSKIGNIMIKEIRPNNRVFSNRTVTFTTK